MIEHGNVWISRTATVENQYSLVPWLELVQTGLHLAPFWVYSHTRKQLVLGCLLADIILQSSHAQMAKLLKLNLPLDYHISNV